MERKIGRVLRTGLLGKAQALLRGLGPKGEYPSRVELRPDSRGEFDEMFAEFGNGSVFLETMNDNSIYVDFNWKNGLHAGLWISASGRGKLNYYHEVSDK